MILHDDQKVLIGWVQLYPSFLEQFPSWYNITQSSPNKYTEFSGGFNWPNIFFQCIYGCLHLIFYEDFILWDLSNYLIPDFPVYQPFWLYTRSKNLLLNQWFPFWVSLAHPKDKRANQVSPHPKFGYGNLEINSLSYWC